MEEKTENPINNRLSRGEIALMAIITPLIFCIIFVASAFILLFISGGANSGAWLWRPIGLIMIFGLFVGWILWIFLIRKLSNKYIKTKILLAIAGLAVITSFLEPLT